MKKIAIIHLFSMGYSEDELFNFDISMANPSTIAELQKLELWRAKFEVASVAQEGMFDRNFVYKKLWNMTDEDIEQIEEGKRKDRMFDLEIEGMQAPAPAGAEGGMAAGGAGGEAGMPPPEGDMGGAPPPTPGGEGSTPPPEPGLPPPPGEEGGAPPPVMAGRTVKGHILTSHKDPNAQVAAPRELMMVDTEKEDDESAFPNLSTYAFGTKKTAMDPKRTRSELTRAIKAPFGETTSPEEKSFRKNRDHLRYIAKELESIDVLMTARNKKAKKIIL